jgi:type VII secretion integral membrane protein EccD
MVVRSRAAVGFDRGGGVVSGRYSRVTLDGDGGRIDVAIPSDVPVGILLPDVLQLVGGPPAAPTGPRRLVTQGGVPLGGADTLAGAQVLDGSLLRLVPDDDVPPPPVVHDVTEAVADDLDLRAWRWGRGPRRWAATGVFVAAVIAAGVAFRANLEPTPAFVSLAGLAVTLTLAGVVAGTLGARPLGTALGCGGGTLGVLAGWTVAGPLGWSPAVRWGVVVAVVAVGLIALGSSSALGRAGLVGGMSMTGLVAGWAVGALLRLDTVEVAALMAVVSVSVLGLLPRLALGLSGVTTLDDRRSAGATVSRYEVEVAVAAAHRGLVIATVATAACAAVAGGLLATEPDPWTLSLAAAVALVTALRARAFPLVGEVFALLGAATAIALLLFAAAGPFPVAPLGGLSGLAVVALTVLTVDLPDHVRARLRGLADRVEAAAVVAVLPLAVGSFGVFERLLETY